MVCIFWNPYDILIINTTERGNAINASSFIEFILKPILKSPQYRNAKSQKQSFTLHMDNATAHTAIEVKKFLKRTGINIAPHPPYSPDLAPSDFYLFGRLKDKLGFTEFTSINEIKNWIRDQFFAISIEERLRVFHEWESRLERCITIHGNYV